MIDFLSLWMPVLLFLACGVYCFISAFRAWRSTKMTVIDVSLAGTTERRIDRDKSPLHYCWVIILQVIFGAICLFVAGYIVYAVTQMPERNSVEPGSNDHKSWDPNLIDKQ